MDDKKKDWLFRIFLTISLVWTAGVSWFLFKDQVLYNGYSPMPLNEIGDFLAGSFSPLAFFWLAYGYFMQNSELKLNRKSLEKQIEEFKESVETQKKALEFNIRQEDIRERRRLFLAQSNFNFDHMNYTEHHDDSRATEDHPTDWVTLNFKVRNSGYKIFNVTFTLLDLNKNPLSIKNLHSIEKHEVTEVHFHKEKIPFETRLAIKYTDSLSIEKEKTYKVIAYCLPGYGPEMHSDYEWEEHSIFDVLIEEVTEGSDVN